MGRQSRLRLTLVYRIGKLLRMVRTKPNPKVKMVKVRELHCLRCGHRWFPRVQDIRICAKCKSARFDEPRKKSA